VKGMKEKFDWADFEIFNCRYVVEGVIINETPLHIGAGREEFGATDNPIIRDISGMPYIPGSSLKGVIRNIVEQYLRSKGEYVCDVFISDEEREKLESEGKEPCLVCRIFGNTRLASHVRVFDARPLNGKMDNIGSRTFTAINRILGVVNSGSLFDMEYVEPGSKFRFKMIIDNIDLLGDDPRADPLLYVLCIMINVGFQVGGRKSIGFGHIKLEKGSFSVKKFSVKDGKLVLEDVTADVLKRLEERMIVA